MTYDIHPVANLFPLIEGPEFAALVADIKANGLLEKIVFQGNTIIDGRNRLRACQEAGVVPEYREISASVDPVTYILSRNIHRRHLTIAQRAAVAAELATMTKAQAGAKGAEAKWQGSNDPCHTDALSIEQAAALLSVSAPSVKRAKKRMKDDPEAHEAVKRGEKPKNSTAEERKVGSKNRTYRTIGKVALTEYARLTGRVRGNSWVNDNIKQIAKEQLAWTRDFSWLKEITEEQANDIRSLVSEFVKQQAENSEDISSAIAASIHSQIDSAKSEAEESRKDIDAPQKTKLERAIKAYEKLLDLRFEQRVKEHMDEILPQYASEYDRYRAINESYSGIFADDEYRLLLSVLHPDRCQPERATQFARAFHLVKSKEDILCKVKSNDMPPSLPSSLSELIARRKPH